MKFDLLESALLHRLKQSRYSTRPRALGYALSEFHRSPGTITIAEVTDQIGLSPRRFSQLFREQVGVSPKLYCRIQRFQRAVHWMHRGADIRWAELALACGYYDQAHFTNDFQAFSGLNPTAYTTTNRIWANHIPLNP